MWPYRFTEKLKTRTRRWNDKEIIFLFGANEIHLPNVTGVYINYKQDNTGMLHSLENIIIQLGN